MLGRTKPAEVQVYSDHFSTYYVEPGGHQVMVCGGDTLSIQVSLSAQPLLSLINLFLLSTREAFDCHPAAPLVVSVTVSREPTSSSFLSFLSSFFPPPLSLETGYLRLASNLI